MNKISCKRIVFISVTTICIGHHVCKFMSSRLYVNANTSISSGQNIYMYRLFGRDRTNNVPDLPAFFKHWISLNIVMF